MALLVACASRGDRAGGSRHDGPGITSIVGTVSSRRSTGMARFTRMQALNAMYETGLVPIFHHADVEIAIDVVRAAADPRSLRCQSWF